MTATAPAIDLAAAHLHTVAIAGDLFAALVREHQGY